MNTTPDTYSERRAADGRSDGVTVKILQTVIAMRHTLGGAAA